MKSLSIIVPTPDGGRLQNLHASLAGQLRDEDEVIVVGDTHGNDLTGVREWVVLTDGWRWEEHDAGRNAWGHPQINHGMAQARGDYLVFQDDDDVFAPGALTFIRRAIRNVDPPRPHLFRFKAARFGGQPIWQVKGIVTPGMIGGHCIVTPNVPEKTGRWTDRYEGDYDFIVETLALWQPLEPIWRPEVISFAR